MLFINYFKNLYNYNVKLFSVVVFFISSSLIIFFLQITNTLYVEASPLVVWGMYSEKQLPKETYHVPLITVNNSKKTDYLNNATALEKSMIINPLLYYKRLHKNADTDERRTFMQSHLKTFYKKWEKQLDDCTNSKNDLPLFFNWYKNYLSQINKEKIDSVNFQLLVVQFSDNKKIIVRDTLNVVKF